MSIILILLFIPHLIVGNETNHQSNMKPFIVNGNRANIADFPYVAHLAAYCVDLQKPFNLSWICGSSIISQNLILTAGHCIFGCSEKTIVTISVGHEYKLADGVSTGHSFIVHEDYEDDSLCNDIAIVRLRTPLIFNETIKRVALMPRPPYKKEGLIAGWGFIDEEIQATSTILLFTQQHVWKKEKCVRLLGWMSEGTFCAANSKKHGFTAQGDSGSALVVDGYIQLGLLSGKDPDISATVAVYTDVGYFYKWIQRSVQSIMCRA